MHGEKVSQDVLAAELDLRKGSSNSRVASKDTQCTGYGRLCGGGQRDAMAIEAAAFQLEDKGLPDPLGSPRPDGAFFGQGDGSFDDPGKAVGVEGCEATLQRYVKGMGRIGCHEGGRGEDGAVDGFGVALEAAMEVRGYIVNVQSVGCSAGCSTRHVLTDGGDATRGV